MKMVQCEQAGHYYDEEVYSQCPYCNSSNGLEKTINIERTVPVTQEKQSNTAGRTVAIIKEKMGIDPVVGWLVCVNGVDKGKDFRIHTDNNYIGRDEKMDICISGDDTISRENHAIISYDSKTKTFYFTPGDSRAIVRHNDNAIFNAVKVNANDIFEIGSTKLIFIPLCSDKFDWEVV